MRIQRVVLLAMLLTIGPVIAGCENFDPDKLDVFGLNEKKKLPGERKALFPEGVPGVTQGIPPEYLKGNQPPPETAQTAPAEGAAAETKAAAAQPAEEPKPKPKAKPKPKPRTASRPPVVQPTQPQMAPWPDQQQQQQSQQQQPAQAQSPWPAPNQSSTMAPWPSSPAPGTFSKQ